MIGIFIGMVLTFERIVLDHQIGTRPLLMLSVLLVVLGAQFFGLGLLGEFLAHGSNEKRENVSDATRETIGFDANRRSLTAGA